MTPITHAIEFTGAGVTLVGPGGILADEPALAAFAGARVLTGHAAGAAAHAAPLFASSRYLEALDTLPLARTRPLVASNADLLFQQLGALAGRLGLAEYPLVAAVSGAYSLEELRLLLGIARAAGLTVRGLVDAGVAATAREMSMPRALYLDLEMHRAVLTELVRGAGLRRGRVDVADGIGLNAAEQVLRAHVARAFVAATRFDPLHQASSERELLARLPAWRALAVRDGGVQATLTHAGRQHQIRVEAEALAGALAPFGAEVLRLVRAARRAGEVLTLFAGARVGEVPGLRERLASLAGVTLIVLPCGAAAAGALAAAAEIEGPEPALLRRLAAAAPALPASALDPGQLPGEAPTHVVFAGRAWALGAEPLLAGRGVSGSRAIAWTGAPAGVSRVHCSLLAVAGEAVLEDLSRYGTYVNGERVERRVRLAVGDRVGLGAPGAEFELVRIVG